jgi:predicted adenylyl cyclase CyaB
VGRNVEIKARIGDPEAVRARAEVLADRPPQVIEQRDTFFDCQDGRLKVRRLGDGSSELIFYRRPDIAGPRESRFLKTPVVDPDGLIEVLGAALGVLGVVRKQRTLYRTGQTRIHLDVVEELGNFLELEVVLEDGQSPDEGSRIARELMARLEVRVDDLEPRAYIDLLAG